MPEEIIIGLEPNTPRLQMHYLLVLDKSGSMEGNKKLTIDGFNEMVQTIQIESNKNNQDAFVTLVLFSSSNSIEVVHSKVPADQLQPLNEQTYTTSGMTALRDAIGVGITEVEKAYQKDEQVFITVFTDGEENNSREYSGKAIAELIKAKNELGWTIAYIGCDIDIDTLAKEYNIDKSNFLSYASGDEKAFRASYTTMSSGYGKMSAARGAGDLRNTGFFVPDTDKKKDDDADSNT